MISKFARLLPPEAAHNAAVWMLENVRPTWSGKTPESLKQSLWGLDFPNPIGLAAGFDKDARAMCGAHGLGFGFVEVGSITPQPQPGNPKPRVFRLPEQRAVINRYGFNSQGVEVAAERLARWRQNPTGLIGVNLGKNKLTEQAADDYVLGANRLAVFADYVVINVSSPNTPGLRAEQAAARLEPLLKAVRAQTDKPLLVKVAPDLEAADIDSICTATLNSGLNGLIVSNTTISRDGVGSDEAGGLSGAPLFSPSTEILRQFALRLEGQLPLIGVGGVSNAAEAYTKIKAGACLVQLYTALIYEGPGMVKSMKRELAALLDADGFANIADAIGCEL